MNISLVKLLLITPWMLNSLKGATSLGKSRPRFFDCSCKSLTVEMNATFWFCETVHIIASSDIWVLWESPVEGLYVSVVSSAFLSDIKNNLGWAPPSPWPHHLHAKCCKKRTQCMLDLSEIEMLCRIELYAGQCYYFSRACDECVKLFSESMNKGSVVWLLGFYVTVWVRACVALSQTHC